QPAHGPRKFCEKFDRMVLGAEPAFCCHLDQPIMLADLCGPQHSLFYLETKAMARPGKLASMSIEALMKYRDEVEAALGRKADELTSQDWRSLSHVMWVLGWGRDRQRLLSFPS